MLHAKVSYKEASKLIDENILKASAVNQDQARKFVMTKHLIDELYARGQKEFVVEFN